MKDTARPAAASAGGRLSASAAGRRSGGEVPAFLFYAVIAALSAVAGFALYCVGLAVEGRQLWAAILCALIAAVDLGAAIALALDAPWADKGDGLSRQPLRRLSRERRR